MKAITLTKITTTTILALALTAGSFQIFAAGSAKGGATALVTQPATVSSAPVAKAMACSQCKDVVGTRETNHGKGAFVKTTSYATHGCPSCGTAVTTTGAGKAQTTSTSHECGAMASGCSKM